ncbi:PREDICTED: uncharacterized protein LOC104810508 [Tarenaya hassleriana]|uniref:uncharacterized protein LOC104810508 n=1 Tax=Tarenaya hassleriana TaxID=28532 RepID=UPI00053C0E03|nr:PREDICTED: uncharacterized protein LOC104810508 [Tarenaya hassleriana]
MAGHIPSPQTQPLTFFHAGLASASFLLLCLSLFICASHSRKNLRRWAACYGSRDQEPVIQLNNHMTMTMMMDENGDPSTMLSGDQRRVPLWQKNILMGGKCQLPDFSGIILYDSEGNVVAPRLEVTP